MCAVLWYAAATVNISNLETTDNKVTPTYLQHMQNSDCPPHSCLLLQGALRLEGFSIVL